MANIGIVAAGTATRWAKGVSPNRGGCSKNSSISKRVQQLLGRESDMLDAIQVLDDAGMDFGEWDVVKLSNADLISRAVLGIALGRGQKIAVDVQLRAIGLIWSYVDGRPSDRPITAPDDASEYQRRMTLADFRAAINAKSGIDDVDGGIGPAKS